MRLRKKIPFFIVLAGLSMHAAAATNPVSWQVSGAFQNPVFTNGSYSVTYSFTSNLPVKMVKALAIEKSASPAGEFTYADHCSGQFLNPHQTCTVGVTLHPAVAGQKSVQLIITGYDSNRVPLPTLTTRAAGQSQIDVNDSVTQSLPATLQVGTPANFSFRFTNAGTTAITGVSTNTNVTATSTCGSTLGAGKSCTVTGTYTPSTANPAVQTISTVFSYAQGSPLTASTSTSVSAVTSGVIGTLVTPNYLPAVMVGGSGNQRTLQFLFTNHNSGAVTITARSATVTTGSGATFVIGSAAGDDSCNNSPVLNNGAACQILGTFTAPTEGSATPFTVTATVTYTGGTGSPSSVTTSTTVVPSLSTSRTVNFVNQCNFPVWFSLHGGALAGSPNCSSNAAVCPSGTSCDSSNGTCFWNNYAPTNNTYQLAANTGTNSVTIPLTSADPNVQWSGAISASTLCSGSSCGQADCHNNGGTTSCAVGQGFSQPATQAEITMNINTSDSYDVEVINGFHLPISMTPGPFVTPNNYNCGAPGANTTGNGFGACDWSSTGAVPPSNAYYWVTTSGTSCNVASPSCTGGTLCGLDSALNQVCGNFLGFWTANQACGVNATTANAFFNCNATLPTNTPPFPAGSLLKQLMACSVPTGDTSPTFNSCYLNYATGTNTSTCCGCMDWWTISGINANSTAQSCTKAGAGSPQTDPEWNSQIQPTVQWLKKACPSIYVYQFDDATSGFSCTNNLPGSQNSVGYTITFCPGGGTGLPTGITEGR